MNAKSGTNLLVVLENVFFLSSVSCQTLSASLFHSLFTTKKLCVHFKAALPPF
jgi:hypothetical protein